MTSRPCKACSGWVTGRVPAATHSTRCCRPKVHGHSGALSSLISHTSRSRVQRSHSADAVAGDEQTGTARGLPRHRLLAAGQDGAQARFDRIRPVLHEDAALVLHRDLAGARGILGPCRPGRGTEQPREYEREEGGQTVADTQHSNLPKVFQGRTNGLVPCVGE